MREYRVPAAYGEAVLAEKRSRFIARVWPVADEQDALGHLEAMRKQYWVANHNVYAYIIRNGPTRYSDDGEPQGTSGMPTLNVLRGRELENALCIVTRYFGGILLGGGGLVRAYSGAAKMAADAAGSVTMRLWRSLLVPCPYPLLDPVKISLAACGGVILNADFGSDVLIEALVPETAADDFLQRLAEISAGGIEAEALGEVFRGA